MGSDRPLRWTTVSIIAIGVLAAVGLAVFWPTGKAPDLGIRPNRYVDASITSVHKGNCPSVEVPGALSGCRTAEVKLTSGSREGSDASFTVLETQFDVPTLHTGDPVVLLDSPSSPSEYRYSFADFQRSSPLIALAIVFGVVVVAFGRQRGVRACSASSPALRCSLGSSSRRCSAGPLRCSWRWSAR